MASSVYLILSLSKDATSSIQRLNLLRRRLIHPNIG